MADQLRNSGPKERDSEFLEFSFCHPALELKTNKKPKTTTKKNSHPKEPWAWPKKVPEKPVLPSQWTREEEA